MILSDTTKQAVAYYRHSAEDKQENSIAIQREQVEQFAVENGIEIIGECIDDGVSGLTAHRKGFQNLLQDWVENDSVQFDYVLVLDVSRFGRFQNPDEAGAYAFRCFMKSKPVIYIKRGFPRPGEELMYSLTDAVERVASGNYSRELSDKVWRGQMKVTQQGYSAGGSAPYGLRRILLDENKQYLQDLLPGQHKVIANQRVTLAPGNKREIQVVQKIFDLFVLKAYSVQEVAWWLNHRHISSPMGRTWHEATIRAILKNHKYTGCTTYNKQSQKLHAAKPTLNPQENWATNPQAFKGIVAKETFAQAQEILRLSVVTVEKLYVDSHELRKCYEAVPTFYQQWLQTWVVKRVKIIRLATYVGFIESNISTLFPGNNVVWACLENAIAQYVLIIKRLIPIPKFGAQGT